MAIVNKTTKTDEATTQTASMKDLYAGSTATAKTDKPAATKYSRAYRVLLKPLVTEKASVIGAINQYVFSVAIDTNKIEVGKAVEAVYGVRPVSVNMIRMQGKAVRYGRTKGRRKAWKKAIVTLPEGKTIQVYEGV
ncbi:MAG: 50S ribosomal protein L23 [Candidatus Falkowbacteria bacterium]